MNACTSLSIICLGRTEFVNGCLTGSRNAQSEGCGEMASEEEVIGTEYNAFDMYECQESLSKPNLQECKQLWGDAIVWSAVILMIDLMMNVKK